jgi:membrane-associated phospholipid phosphatase
MGVPAAHGLVDYGRQLANVVAISFTQLVRPPSHSRRAIAARRLSHNSIMLFGGCGLAIVVAMYAIDVSVINLMPPRGSPDLWPVRILTDFGKAAYVLWSLGFALIAIAVIVPFLAGSARAAFSVIGLRIQFVFFAVAVPNLIGEIIKDVVGRGRPFVGGRANAFNYSPFAGTEQFASFPSGHVTTAFALAFAVAAVWPWTRPVMAAYALLIAASRIVLLAHHPSDALAGALVGILGAMVVRQWFAARRLGFIIRANGTIVPLTGPSFATVKGVADGPSAP